jgi:hypothetical protein
VEGYDHREIAQLLRCSTGNSKSQLHKARMKIREMLLATKDEHENAGEKSKPRSRGMAATAANPARARTESAPKGYEELLFNCWKAAGLWADHFHGHRGL